jgi:uncharacterized protein
MNHSEVSQLNFIEVILKTVERCNLNCSYCYFFNGGDQSYKKHPPFIRKDTILQITDFLEKGIAELGLKKIQIDFHGGEPTLQKKTEFDWMCTYLKDRLAFSAEVVFAMQTNGTLIDDEWIELFKKHDVGIGVSLDGPQKINDLLRVDHKGRGSHAKVVQGLKLLQQKYSVSSVGILSVINVNTDPREVYRHYVHELGVTRMDFLLPDFTHDNFKNQDPQDYGSYLCALFDEWTLDDNPHIYIRILNLVLSLILGTEAKYIPFNYFDLSREAITISSNGDLSPDDAFRSGWPAAMQLANARDTSLKSFLNRQEMQMIREARMHNPPVCKKCCWEKICHGGRPLINRFSKNSGFDNPSVYCAGLKKFYTEIANYLLKNGFSKRRLQEALL